MGHIERVRIKNTLHFVKQLGELKVPSGCLQASLLAMGAADIHLQDVVYQHEHQTGIKNVDAYLHDHKLALGASFSLKNPFTTTTVADLLDNPGVILAQSDYNHNSGKRIAGLLLAFGEYDQEPPHVIGILPRNDMTRNLREILKRDNSHVIVDTSVADDPIYLMKVDDITNNLNALIVNGIDVSLHFVTRLKY